MLTRRLTLAGPLLAALAYLSPAAAQGEAGVVNVYTNREPGPYSATLEEFTKATGIRVNAIFAETGLAQRIQAEGASSLADVYITVDIGRLQEAVDLGITQPIRSEALAAYVPEAFRDANSHWHALSLRSRVIYVSKQRVNDAALTYESLAEPRWRGRLCIRSGQHPYNIALIAHMIAKRGEAATEQWLRGVKANLARPPSGGDRDVAKDIAAGLCDVGLANAYYVGLMSNTPAQRPWADAIRVVLPTFEGGGTHLNVSGIALVKTAPNADNARKLIEFMVSERAQRTFADVNFEYPVRSGIAVNALIGSMGQMTPDAVPVSQIAANRRLASEIVERVGFDR